MQAMQPTTTGKCVEGFDTPMIQIHEMPWGFKGNGVSPLIWIDRVVRDIIYSGFVKDQQRIRQGVDCHSVDQLVAKETPSRCRSTCKNK